MYGMFLILAFVVIMAICIGLPAIAIMAGVHTLNRTKIQDVRNGLADVVDYFDLYSAHRATKWGDRLRK